MKKRIISYFYSLIIPFSSFIFFISLSLPLPLITLFSSKSHFFRVLHITFIQSHIVRVYQFFTLTFCQYVFFLSNCVVVFIMFQICTKIRNVILLSSLVFPYFLIYEFQEFFCIYFDEELKFSYKIITQIKGQSFGR